MYYFLLILGLEMIVKSSDVLIDSSSKIAKRFGVSTFIIGITVIAFGTSAPELAVGIASGISRINELTLGNVIGSSISNIALIVGLSAIIMPLNVKDSAIRREIPMLIGGKLTVSSSTQIAQSIGLSETLIGLTVVAFATTLPEMITSIMAAIKKEPDIVLGNCIGSNIFNILLVLGSSSFISPISVESTLLIDSVIMIVITIFVLIISWTYKEVKRRTGITLLITYISYIVYKVISTII